MRFRVISLRSSAFRIGAVVMLVLSAILFLLSRIVTASPPASTPIAVYRVQTAQRAMSLTVNVVWGTEYVPILLQEFRQAGVHATFMVGGAWAASHPAILKTMVQDGMEIGNHGWNHRHPNTLSQAEITGDLASTNRMVQKIVGVSPKVYAPPYGEFNRVGLRAAASLGMPLVMWTIDTIDWRPTSSAAYMVDKVLAQAAPGAIVLMHPTDRTAMALPRIIAGLKRRGYQLVSVSRLITLGIPRSDS
ncbi:MAG: polysaccharide deacetylase family protein [Thermaerobacter sp.]|nr:polysaccharide deacetylase family protein [Thermaerobacter sp.]